MIHNHTNMRGFLRNVEKNLPSGDDTTLITRNTPDGPVMYALNMVTPSALGATMASNFMSLSLQKDIANEIVSKLSEEVTIHEHKK